jgi:hypothetical protein
VLAIRSIMMSGLVALMKSKQLGSVNILEVTK